ncbi:MAG: 23S rRNA (adenine(1618)-N(6))-methyltransferase RlmF [Methylophilaceae bacterium]
MKSDHPDAPAEKPGLHPRNKHKGRYDFDRLIQASSDLARFVKLNAYSEASIDFANADAVKALNRALLKQYYDISGWDIPPHYLCPPIPGRADYLHHIADLLALSSQGRIPHGLSVRVLDIGVGANIIYPLIGHREYGWQFVGADIDPIALENAQRILEANPGLDDSITLRLQTSATAIFNGIMQPDEFFDLSLCNPPFHASLDEASEGTRRKWQGLGKTKGNPRGKNHTHSQQAILNFGGQSAELYCEGGEEAFINRMISESAQFAGQCLWFTTLVSKASSLPGIYRALKKVNAQTVKTINMAQGQKRSRVVAWTFLTHARQLVWRNSPWQAS